MGMPRWYVARTKPRSEFAAASELERDGYETYCPIVKSSESHPRHVNAPLFPGYLFLRFDATAQTWPSFRSGHRVIGLLNFQGQIPWLSDEIVSNIMGQVDLINSKGYQVAGYSKGDKVEIVSDVIGGIAEVLEDTRSATVPVRVLLAFMDKVIKMQVPFASVRPFNDNISPLRPSRRTRGKGRWCKGFKPIAS